MLASMIRIRTANTAAHGTTVRPRGTLARLESAMGYERRNDGS